MNGIDSFVVGHFCEINKAFKQLICSLAKVAADLQEAGNIIPASSTDHKKKGAYAFFKKRFKVALGCMATRTQTELMIRRVQFIRREQKKLQLRQPALEIPNATNQNMVIHGSVTGKTMIMFLSYNNCYYSSSETVTDDEDEL